MFIVDIGIVDNVFNDAVKDDSVFLHVLQLTNFFSSFSYCWCNELVKVYFGCFSIKHKVDGNENGAKD